MKLDKVASDAWVGPNGLVVLKSTRYLGTRNRRAQHETTYTARRNGAVVAEAGTLMELKARLEKVST